MSRLSRRSERRERRLRQVEVLEQQAAADAQLAGEEERPEDRIARDRAASWRRSTRGARSAWRASWPGWRRS